MKWSVLLVTVALAGGASADTGFRPWVRKWAADHQGAIVGWGTANLEGDSHADSLAELCLPDGGIYLVEDSGGRRFAAHFERWEVIAQPCPSPATEPPWKPNPARLVWRSSEKRAHHESELALRDHQLVVVAEGGGGGRYCQYQDQSEIDWDRLSRRWSHESAYQPGKEVDSCIATSVVHREEAIFLVGHDGAPLGSSFRVSVRQPKEHQLSLRIALHDDDWVRPAARTLAAVDAADHLQLWIGKRSLRLARDDKGWFAIPAGIAVQGDADSVKLVVPLEWADWVEQELREVDVHLKPSGSVPPLDNQATWIGSLVVAFTDVDPAGGHVVHGTAPLLGREAPVGLLVKLPRGARHPTASYALEVVPLED